MLECHPFRDSQSITSIEASLLESRASVVVETDMRFYAAHTTYANCPRQSDRLCPFMQNYEFYALETGIELKCKHFTIPFAYFLQDTFTLAI